MSFRESRFANNSSVRETNDDCQVRTAFIGNRKQAKPAPAEFKPEPPKITGDARQYVPPKTQFGKPGRKARFCMKCGAQIGDEISRYRNTCSDECRSAVRSEIMTETMRRRAQ